VIMRDTPGGRQLVATGYNRPITEHDPTAHAEIVALRHAATLLDAMDVVELAEMPRASVARLVVQRSAQQLDPQQTASADPDPHFMAMAAALLHGALPLSLGDAAFEHLTSPGSALPGRVASAHN